MEAPSSPPSCEGTEDFRLELEHVPLSMQERPTSVAPCDGMLEAPADLAAPLSVGTDSSFLHVPFDNLTHCVAAMATTPFLDGSQDAATGNARSVAALGTALRVETAAGCSVAAPPPRAEANASCA